MNLLNTADHKRIGQVQIVVSLLALAVAGSAAIAVRAMASGGTVDHFDAFSSLDHALAGVFVVLPLFRQRALLAAVGYDRRRPCLYTFKVPRVDDLGAHWPGGLLWDPLLVRFADRPPKTPTPRSTR